MEENLKGKAIKGVAWNFAGSYANKFIQFVISIVLARLLAPADYGLLGMLGFFMGIASVFIDSGFSSALIQKKDKNNEDYCTVFYVNLGMSLLMYAILFFSAPMISEFYNQPILSKIIRIYSLSLIIGALSAINSVRLTIDINFKTNTIINTIAGFGSGIIGITCALKGYGVWSLVIQQLSNGIIRASILFYYIRWIPSLTFSTKSFRQLFSFGSKLLVSGLLHSAYSNMYPLVIGKEFSATDLGYVTRAQGFNDMAASTVNNALSSVAFPILTKVQDDDETLLRLYSKYIKLSAFIISPILLLLCGIAKPLVIFLLGAKWESCVILLQILSVSYIWDGITKINLNLLYVKGRSDLFLKLEIIKKTIAVCILIISVIIGNLIIFCVGITLYSCIALYLNTYYTNKLLGLSFLTQMKQISPYLAFGGLVLLEGLIFSYIISIPIIAILLSSTIGIVLYLLLCKTTHQYAIIEFANIISTKTGKLGRKFQNWVNQ